MDIESGAPRPPHRVKYLAAVVVAVTIAMMAVIAVIVDAPGRISRALSGSSGKDLFSSSRLDAELDVVLAELGGLSIGSIVPLLGADRRLTGSVWWPSQSS